MFVLPELPYGYNSLEPFIDEETMRIHHGGHHATYIKKLNEALIGLDEFLNMDIRELLQSLDKIPEELRTKVKNNAGGHYHHSLFWTMIAPPSGQEPEGKLLNEIKKEFGGVDEFKESFNLSAAGVFGSGWTWLVLDNGRLSIVSTFNQDSPLSTGQTIILGIDLWEHAYYLKYKNKRAEFIEAWWNVANWEEAERRFQQASLG